jgi:hypothetical protein
MPPAAGKRAEQDRAVAADHDGELAGADRSRDRVGEHEIERPYALAVTKPGARLGLGLICRPRQADLPRRRERCIEAGARQGFGRMPCAG